MTHRPAPLVHRARASAPINERRQRPVDADRLPGGNQPAVWPGVAIGTFALAVILSLVAAGPGVVPGDVAVARAIQRVDFPRAGDLAGFAHWIGNRNALVAVATAVSVTLWLNGLNRSALLVAVAALLRELNPWLKEVFDSPRPTEDLVQITEQANNTGFPSGHTMGVTILYGTLILVAERTPHERWARRLVQAGLLAVILVTGWGRVYTGAHWPTDVLGGFLWGAVVIALLFRLPSRVWMRYRANEPPVAGGYDASEK